MTEIKANDFSNVDKLKSLIRQYMKSAKVNEISTADFEEALKNIEDDLNEFIITTGPIIEKIEEWFKRKPETHQPKKTAWEKMAESNSPGLTRHKKKLQRRKKR